MGPARSSALRLLVFVVGLEAVAGGQAALAHHAGWADLLDVPAVPVVKDDLAGAVGRRRPQACAAPSVPRDRLMKRPAGRAGIHLHERRAGPCP